ncbi:hypothetical protein ISG33_10435 [Glaciecola sp. MH2013]|uniref:hypothetical protein n=1 Tax=Glaciecola sp. MH2013 TaxID=2785524 RepID=UPI001DBC8864|nr:hypothetical protein [Glaciecola sp. MH2013]MBF7073815.1 hypothetical protein [Glaciecola sp. MH2013]
MNNLLRVLAINYCSNPCIARFREPLSKAKSAFFGLSTSLLFCLNTQAWANDSLTISGNGEPVQQAASSLDTQNTANKQEKVAQHSPINYCFEQAWLDDWYCHFNYGLEASVHEINTWFIQDNEASNSAARASGRLRFGWEPRSGDLNQFDFRFKVKVKLPALQNRLELLLSDDEEDVNQQAVKAARSAQLGNDDSPTVALQFKDKSDSKIAYRLGLGRGSQVYARARYKDAIDLSEKSKFSYFAEVNYYSDDQIGVEVEGAYSVNIDKNQAYEFENTFRYRDKTEDMFWRHQFQYLYLQDAKRSYLFTAMIDGLNKPTYRAEQVLFSMRYKQNVLRPWLFIELEPYVIWLREEDFRTSYGVALRTEIHFPNN